jgi:2-desacetyl-2-hydroxyethyl bacteriochlorophyllide A dehydrogenase
MLAARFYEPNVDLRLEDIALPKIGENDVLVGIRASGICGSEIHVWKGRDKSGIFPRTLGHEGAGVIEKVGDNVKGVSVGERVLVDYGITCGSCRFCRTGRENLCVNLEYVGYQRDGTFQEYLAVPARNAIPLPNSVSFEEGAIISCGVVTAFHGTRQADMRIGDHVVIVGLGGVGLHGIQFARLQGASEIMAVDLLDEKLKIAKELGADYVVNPSKEDFAAKAKELWGGADITFEFIGLAKTLKDAMRSLGRAGKLVVVGMCFQDLTFNPEGDFRFLEAQIRGSSDHTSDDLRKVLELASSKKVDLSKSITHRLKLEEVNNGFQILDTKQGNPNRIVLIQP